MMVPYRDQQQAVVQFQIPAEFPPHTAGGDSFKVSYNLNVPLPLSK